MKQVLQNSIKWVLQMWPFILILAGGTKWYANDKVAQEAVKDSLEIVLKNSREMKQTTKDFYAFRKESDTRFNMLEGGYKALDNSYIRTLQSQIKDKNEQIMYQREKIEALDEALKKND